MGKYDTELKMEKRTDTELDGMDAKCREMLSDVLSIVGSGNDAEVRRTKDGEFAVYELRRSRKR